jgi:hypothetical protein
VHAWYGMVWCPSYPPSVCSVTEGGGVIQRLTGQVTPTDWGTDSRAFSGSVIRNPPAHLQSTAKADALLS